MAGLEGDGSYVRLLINTYGISLNDTDYSSGNYKEYATEIAVREYFVQTSLSHTISGRYTYETGNRTNRGYGGTMWAKRSLYKSNQKTANYLNYTKTSVAIRGYYNYRGLGYSLRRVAKSCVLNVLMLI